MPWFDLPPDEVRRHRTTTEEPADLDAFWAARLAEARDAASPVELRRHAEQAYGPLAVWDVRLSGARGDPVRAWYLRPPGSEDSALPIVVRFIGYGGGRGAPSDHTLLPAAGYATLVMDTRGQGGTWSSGATSDAGTADDGPQGEGVVTRGIASPETYYYTRLFVDAARAVEVAAGLEGVDPERVAVAGGSQGGALALAAAALVPDRVKVCVADVPFLCDISRAVTLVDTSPYGDVAAFLAVNPALVAPALDTLRYVDCALLARRIRADCLVGVGLMDDICPPSTVYAAYAEIPSAKQVVEYPFGVHSLATSHAEVGLQHLRDRL